MFGVGLKSRMLRLYWKTFGRCLEILECVTVKHDDFLVEFDEGLEEESMASQTSL